MDGPVGGCSTPLTTSSFVPIPAGWEEWRTEEDLLRLVEKMPHRYFRGEDGQWHCPPGEGVAEPLGFYYRIRSICRDPLDLAP